MGQKQNTCPPGRTESCIYQSFAPDGSVSFDPAQMESPEDIPDDVPKDVSREELHKMLWQVYNKAGKENNMGLGLYSGVRFHIDTCGFRNW